jgi:hypothetical protein
MSKRVVGFYTDEEGRKRPITESVGISQEYNPSFRPLSNVPTKKMEMGEDWDLILKINDSLWDTFHRREKMRGEIYSTQEYPGVYIVKREISKEEGKYGPGVYIEKFSIVINKKMFKNISTTKGPLAWYIKQINGKVYENDNVIVIIPSDRDEIEIDKLRWAIDKLEIKDEYHKAVRRQIDEELRLKKMRKSSG